MGLKHPKFLPFKGPVNNGLMQTQHSLFDAFKTKASKAQIPL